MNSIPDYNQYFPRTSSISPTQSPYPTSLSPGATGFPSISGPSTTHSFRKKTSICALASARNAKKPRKNVKKAKKGLIYLKLNLKESVASGLINPINKVQLSILNTGLIKINDEVSKASGIVPKKPFDLNKSKFKMHLELLRKYKVLLDIEFHVSN